MSTTLNWQSVSDFDTQLFNFLVNTELSGNVATGFTLTPVFSALTNEYDLTIGVWI